MNELAADSGVQVLEGFPCLDGSFVGLVNGGVTLLAAKKKLGLVLDWALLENVDHKIPEAFYNLQKTALKDSLIILETKTLPVLLCLCELGLECDLDIFEIRSARSLTGKNLAYLTGSTANCLRLKTRLKSKKSVVTTLIEEIQPSFLDFFSFRQP